MKHQSEAMATQASRPLRSGPRSLMDALYAWRATQVFAKTVVDEATLHSLLYAALQAPCPSGELPAFAIVRSKPLLHKLSLAILNEAVLEDVAARGRDATVVNGASALAIIFEDRDTSEAVMNGWLTASALMLAASGMGLGSCPMAGAISVLDQPYWRASLEVSPDLCPVAAIALGWPSSEGVKLGMKSPNILSWTD